MSAETTIPGSNIFSFSSEIGIVTLYRNEKSKHDFAHFAQNSKNFLLELTWLIVPTFDTKVTEYLCSGWVFFLQTKFDFLTSHF